MMKYLLFYIALLFSNYISAKHYNKGKSDIKIAVKRIDSYKNYANLTSYLEKSPSVNKVFVSDVDGEQVKLNVQVVGELSDFYRQLHADGRLAFAEEESVYYAPEREKVFQWVQ